MSDVYENLAMRWQWPNRRQDIDYSNMTMSDIAELDERARAEGWFDKAKLDVSKRVSLGYREGGLVQPSKKWLKGLEDARKGWLNATGDAAVIPAHAWHCHMEQMDLWRGEDQLALPSSLYAQSDFDACSELMYSSFVSIYEYERMLFNGTLRAWIWLHRQQAAIDSGMSVPDDAKAIADCLRWIKECFDSLWFTSRRDGWTVRLPDGYFDSLSVEFSLQELGLLYLTGSRRDESLARFGRDRVGARDKQLKGATAKVSRVIDESYKHRLFRCFMFHCSSEVG